MLDETAELELPLSADLERAVAAWLAHLQHERGHADKTLEAYARDVRQFLGFVAQQLGYAPCLADLAKLDLKAFRGFLASRRRSARVSRSLARSLSALRQLFRWLEAQNLVENRKILQLAMPKVPHSVPKPLTVGKAAGVVDAGPGAELDWVLARDAAVLMLLYGSGLRIAEALSIRAKDAPTPDRDVLRIKGKGGKERLVPVLPVVREAVARYLQLCPIRWSPTSRCSAVLRADRCRRASSSSPWSGCASRWICRPPRRRTRCATRSPRTCFRPAATCGRSRNCSVTPRCRPRRRTPRLIAIGCSPFMTQHIRAPEVPREFSRLEIALEIST